MFPDGGFKVLDRNEYKYHKKIMHYGKELNSIIENELSNLIEMKKSQKGPFKPNIVLDYYQKFKQL